MFLYFNENGRLLKSLTHGTPARAGSTDFEIFAYFKDVDVNTTYTSGVLYLKKPDGSGNYVNPFQLTPQKSYLFLQRDGETKESVSPFKFGKNYTGFYFNFASSTLDERVLLDTPGNWTAYIKLYGANGTESVEGEITFTVQDGPTSEEGTEGYDLEEEIEDILRILGTKANVKGNKTIRFLKDISEYAYLDESIYSVGDIIFDEATHAFYKIANLNPLFKAKVELLTPAQIEAINSGITAEKVAEYDEKISILPNKKQLILKNDSLEAFGSPSLYEVGQIIMVKNDDIQKYYEVKIINSEKVFDPIFDFNNNEKVDNKTTSLTPTSTDTQYPTAKVVYDNFKDVRERVAGKNTSFIMSIAEHIPTAETLSSYIKGDGTAFESMEEFSTYVGVRTFGNNIFNSQADSITVDGQAYYLVFNVGDKYRIVIDLNGINLGDNVYLVEKDLPDRWCYESGKFAPLETTKVPLENYYTKTETNALIGAVEDDLDEHVENSTIHVTASDKTNWNGKVDKVSTANKVYGTDSTGAQTTYDKNSFGQVDDVKVNNVSVVTNKVANIDLTGKLNKSNQSSGYYAYTRESGVDTTKQFTSSLVNNTIVSRDSNGCISVGTPTSDSHATTKLYVDTVDNGLSERITNLEARGRFLSGWNAQTGKPDTEPDPELIPYAYKAGDYFNITNVDYASQYTNYDPSHSYVIGDKVIYNNTSYVCVGATTGAWDSTKWQSHTPANFKPTGTHYTGAASVSIETRIVSVGDSYTYDGKGNWILQINTEKTITIANVVGLQSALDSKQPNITSSAKLESDLVNDTNQTNKFVTSSEKTTWNNKVSQVSTINRVYGTDASGNQTTYDTNSFGHVDDVKINGTSVVTNKVANIFLTNYVTTNTNQTIYANKTIGTGNNLYFGSLYNNCYVNGTDDSKINFYFGTNHQYFGLGGDGITSSVDIYPFSTSSMQNIGSEGSVWNYVYTNYLHSGRNGIAVDNIESKLNKVTSISALSTDTQYPSAKCVYTVTEDIREIAAGKAKNYIINTQSEITGTKASDGSFTNVTAITGITLTALKLGDNILIKETSVPDLWVSQISPTYSLSILETAKIPVTDVQVDGTSVVNNTVANVVTTGLVHKTGDETISGDKTFNDDVSIGGNLSVSVVNGKSVPSYPTSLTKNKVLSYTTGNALSWEDMPTEIYFCTDSTVYADVTVALGANKLPIYIKNNVAYIYSGHSSANYFYSFQNVTDKSASYYKLKMTGGWELADSYTIQEQLVSGTNIKTINNQSILGSGDLTIVGGVTSVNGKTGEVVLKTSDLTNDSNYVTQSWVGQYYRTSTAQDAIDVTKESVSNKVTSISSASTDTQYASAKCVYDKIETKNVVVEVVRL